MKTALNDKGQRLRCRQRCSFQTEKVIVTSSRYPSENTFVRRQDICLAVAKIQRICANKLRRERLLSRYRAAYPVK